MSEVNIKSGKSSKKHQSKVIRVDLTPMVDLGFLLITFFILTTTMQQASEIKLVLPKDSPLPINVPASKTLTFILNRNDSISYYDGFAKEIKQTGFAALRNIIQQKQISLSNKNINKDGLVIIIKPTIESTYKNLIDALDEMYINDCKHYFIVDPDKREAL